jgi:putative transposase
MIAVYHLSTNLKAYGLIKDLQIVLVGDIFLKSEPIHQSDRGFHYCSDDYLNLLNQADVLISMTQESDPYENAIAERVNGILKDKFVIGEGFINHLQVSKEISQSIQTYKTKRPHLSCKLKTPMIAHRNPNFKLKRWDRLLTKSQLLTKA